MSVKAKWQGGTTRAVFAAAVVLNLTAAALAQDNAVRPPVLPPQPPGTGVPEKVDPPLNSQGSDATGTLSEKLNKSEGVIQPPGGVDPAIRMAPPATGGTMPVIPPPGEPGGNPSIQPK